MDLETSLHDLVDAIEGQTGGVKELLAARLRQLDVAELLALTREQITELLTAEIMDVGTQVLQARGPVLARAGARQAREAFG